MTPDRQILIEALRKRLDGIQETTGRLYFLALEMPRDEACDKVRDEVSCLDSIAAIVRQALDAIERKA